MCSVLISPYEIQCVIIYKINALYLFTLFFVFSTSCYITLSYHRDRSGTSPSLRRSLTPRFCSTRIHMPDSLKMCPT
jgi:hypothetical protein